MRRRLKASQLFALSVGVLGLFAAAEFRLSLASVPAGYTETNTGNNTAATNLTGLSAFPVTGFLGVCLPI